MNQKQLLILVVVLAVLGGAALMILKKNSDALLGGSSSRNSGGLLGDLPVGEELARFIINDGSTTLTLAKVDGIWRLKERGDYPADYAEISRTVLKLRDLKAGQTEAVGAAQLGRLELLPPGTADGGGTLIELRDATDQVLASLLLGKTKTRLESAPSQFGGGEPREVPVGRWVMDPSVKTKVNLISDPLENIHATPRHWLSKDFFKVAKIKSIRVTYPDVPTNSFRLTRETESGEWTIDGLKDGEELDTSQTSGFNYALSNPSFSDVIVDGDEAALGLDAPTIIIIETFEGFVYEIQAGTKTADGIPMRVTAKGNFPRKREAAEDEDESVKLQKDTEFASNLKTLDERLEKEQALEPWTFLVSSWTLDSVLKRHGDLVKQPEPEEPPAGATANPAEALLNLPSAQ